MFLYEFAPKTFHEICDHHSDTVTIIKVKKVMKILEDIIQLSGNLLMEIVILI